MVYFISILNTQRNQYFQTCPVEKFIEHNKKNSKNGATEKSNTKVNSRASKYHRAASQEKPHGTTLFFLHSTLSLCAQPIAA